MEASPLFPDTLFDRDPPYNLEAETAVLGGMLIDGSAVDKVLEIVSEGMFYREGNRRIFRAMIRIFQGGAVIDPLRQEYQADQLAALADN